MNLVHTAIGASALFVLSGLMGCKPKTAAPQMQMPPPIVTIAKPEQQKVTDWDQYTGRLEAKESVEIRPRVSGWLDKIHFTEGSEVKMGDLLFSIDPRPYRLAADRAEAEFARSESRETQTKNEFSRVKQLVETKAISQEDFETRGKAYSEAQSASRAAKAALEIAKLDLEFTQVRAPIAGRIGRALVTQGNLVSAGMAGSGASSLTSIVSISPIYLYVDANEAASLRYRRLFSESKGAQSRIPCEMGVGDDDAWPHKGYIDFVDNRVDPNTGTVKARAVFEASSAGLAPGFYARLRVPASEEKLALLIPETCIGSDQANRFVFIVNPAGMAEVRPVKLGTALNGMRIVRDGLKGDEDVIVNGQARVRPGIPVKAERAVK